MAPFLLVAVLSCSRRICARAFLSERQDDWRGALSGAFRHFGVSRSRPTAEGPTEKSAVVRYDANGKVQSAGRSGMSTLPSHRRHPAVV